jgi:hypothetical protein
MLEFVCKDERQCPACGRKGTGIIATYKENILSTKKWLELHCFFGCGFRWKMKTKIRRRKKMTEKAFKFHYSILEKYPNAKSFIEDCPGKLKFSQRLAVQHLYSIKNSAEDNANKFIGNNEWVDEWVSSWYESVFKEPVDVPIGAFISFAKVVLSAGGFVLSSHKLKIKEQADVIARLEKSREDLRNELAAHQ